MSEEISRLIDGEIGTEQTELLFESITIGKQQEKQIVFSRWTGWVHRDAPFQQT